MLHGTLFVEWGRNCVSSVCLATSWYPADWYGTLC